MNGIEFENEDKMKDNESTTGDDASEADSGEEMEGVQVAQSFGDGESEACFERKVKSVFQNVFRSKGFLWIAGKDDSMGEWSQAGIIVTVSNSGKWYVNKPEEMEEFDEDMKTAILSDFDKDPKIGDRRQEIVFIGDFKKDEEKEALRYALDKCLMQDNETFDPTEDPWEEWY